MATSKRLSPGEFDELLAEVALTSARDALVLCLLHDSALRIEDAMTIRLDDFSPDRSLLRVRDGKARKGTGIVDTLPVSQRSIEQLDAYVPERPDVDGPLILSSRGSKMHQQHYRRLLARVGMQVLGKHVHPHMLRHTSISEAALGVGDRPALPLPIVQRFARHRNLATTQQYIHADESWASDMRDWMAG